MTKLSKLNINEIERNGQWNEIDPEITGIETNSTRIKKGIFWEALPSIDNSFINLSMIWDKLEVDLVIDENGCRIFSQKK